MELSDLKRKIRQLKKLEAKIRFNVIVKPGAQLVWDDFFGSGAKYPIDKISSMSREEYKAIVGEYMLCVYYRFYKETGIAHGYLHDPDALSNLELPHDADFGNIKSRFRELAKRYHPDSGGDADKFIELMDNYQKLIK